MLVLSVPNRGKAVEYGELPRMDRIIRILTAGKSLETIDQEIADAIQSGSRVLVKTGSLTASFPKDGLPAKLDSERKVDSENSIIAKWAEGLSHEHGLVWQRVGPDVLFAKAVVQKLGSRV